MYSRYLAGAVAAVSLASLACGGATSSGESGHSDCRITLSGAATGTFDCAASATLSWDPIAGEIAFLQLGVSDADAARTGVMAVKLQVHLPLPPVTRTYQGTEAGVDTLLFVAKDMEHTWETKLGRLGNTGGPVSVTISSIEAPIDAASATHPVHGTLHGTLPRATGGSTGDVILDATF